VGLEIDFRPFGSTTWKRSAEQCGVESDLCYYFDQAKLEASDAAASRESNDVADYPNPDLAAEIDISPSQINRPKIDAALQVTEVWRFKDDTVSIEQLGPNGVYLAVTSSRFLHVRPDEVTRWLADGKSGRRLDWRRRLQDWIQAELRPRVVAKP
jgi:Uma2 family endonuclease